MTWKFLIPAAMLGAVVIPTTAIAHGAKLDYQTVSAIEVIATYDNGDPMVEAQIAVYTPEDPNTPWLTATTDDQGRFTFTPDPNLAGNWEVSVRQAGHGDIVAIPVGTEMAAAEAGSAESTQVAPMVAKRNREAGYTVPQIVLMGAAGIWGFIGTALFFSRSKA